MTIFIDNKKQISGCLRKRGSRRKVDVGIKG